MGKTKPYRKPLLGKVFYLDVTKYRNLSSLEANFVLLGASLEKCFSKEVHCLVTDNVEYTTKFKALGTSPSNPSPGTPSPLSAGLLRGSVGSPPADSPGEAVSTNRLTRGQKLLDARKKKTYGTLIENAQKWKIQIITLEKALKFIENKLAEMPASVKNAAINKSKSKAFKSQKRVRKLKGHFLKFETTNKHFRPVQQEFAEFPVIALNSSSNSLFDKKKQKCGQPGTMEEGERAECGGELEKNVGIDTVEESVATPNTSKQKVPPSKSAKKKGKEIKKKTDPYAFSGEREIYTAGELRRIFKEKIRAEQRKGYCEICKAQYKDIKKHQWTDMHLNFVRDVDNFAGLDTMIETGPNLDKFLSDVVKYHQEHVKEGMYESELEEEVMLIREGLSSPLVQGKKKRKLFKSSGLRQTPLSGGSSQKRLNFQGAAGHTKKKPLRSARNSPKKITSGKKDVNAHKGTKSIDNKSESTQRSVVARESPKLQNAVSGTANNENHRKCVNKDTSSRNPVNGNDVGQTANCRKDQGVVEDSTSSLPLNNNDYISKHVASSSKQYEVAIDHGSTSSLPLNDNVQTAEVIYEIVTMEGSPVKHCSVALNFVESPPGKTVNLNTANNGGNFTGKPLFLNKEDNILSPGKKRTRVENLADLTVDSDTANDKTNFTSQDSGIQISPSSPQLESDSQKSNQVKNNSSIRKSSRLCNKETEGSIVSNSVQEEGSLQTELIGQNMLPGLPLSLCTNAVVNVNSGKGIAGTFNKKGNINAADELNLITAGVSSQNVRQEAVIQNNVSISDRETNGREIRGVKSCDKNNSGIEVNTVSVQKVHKLDKRDKSDSKTTEFKKLKSKQDSSKGERDVTTIYTKEKENPNKSKPGHRMSDCVKKKGKTNTAEKTKEEKLEMKRKKKIKKKLKDSWQVLSDRSMRKMFESEGDHDFDGYTADSIIESELPLDVSYIDLTEIEYSDNSEVEWIFSEVEEARPPPKCLPSILNLVQDHGSGSDRASSGWNENIDSYVDNCTESEIRRITRSTLTKRVERVETSYEGENLENNHNTDQRKVAASETTIDRSFEIERSLIEKHKGKPVEMLNHVFNRYLSGGEVENLWLDPPNQKHLKIQEHLGHVDRQVSQDASVVVNVSQDEDSCRGEGIYDQLSPEIPFVGASKLKAPDVNVNKSAAKIQLSFQNKTANKENSVVSHISASTTKTMSLRALEDNNNTVASNMKRLGELQQAQNFGGQDFNGLMHSTPLHLNSNATTAKTVSSSFIPSTPFGVKYLSPSHQSKRLKMNSSGIGENVPSEANFKEVVHGRTTRNTRKSLNSVFENHEGENSLDKSAPGLFGTISVNLQKSDDSNPGWQFGADFEGECQVDKEIVFNFNTPQKINTQFSPFKTLDVQFLRNLNTSKSPNTSVVRNLSGALLSQAGLEVSTLVRKKRQGKTLDLNESGNRILSPKSANSSGKKLMRSVSQDLKDGARYKFDYMASKKRKKLPKVKWYAAKVYKSKIILNNALYAEKGKDTCANLENTPNNKKLTTAAKKQTGKKLLSPRRNRGKKQSDNKSVFSFKSGHTVRLKMMMKKPRRGCLCHEHTPSSRCPNANEYKKLQTSSPRRSCSRSPAKRIKSPIKVKKLPLNTPHKAVKSPLKIVKSPPKGRRSPLKQQNRQSVSRKSPVKVQASSRLTRSPTKSAVNSSSHSRKQLRSVSPSKQSGARQSRFSTFNKSKEKLEKKFVQEDFVRKTPAKRSNTVFEFTSPSKRSPLKSQKQKFVLGDSVRKTPAKRGNTVFEFTSPNKQSPLKSISLSRSLSYSKRCLSVEKPLLAKKTTARSTSLKNSRRKRACSKVEQLAKNSVELQPDFSKRICSSSVTESSQVSSEVECNEKKATYLVKKVARYLKSVKTARKQLRKRDAEMKRSLRSTSNSVTVNSLMKGDNLYVNVHSSMAAVTSEKSKFNGNERKSVRKRTRSVANLDTSLSSPSNSRKPKPTDVKYLKKSAAKLKRLVVKRSRSTSCSSVASSVQSDGERKRNALLKRLNVNLTDEELCAMFVPTATRSCSSASSDTGLQVSRTNSDQEVVNKNVLCEKPPSISENSCIEHVQETKITVKYRELKECDRSPVKKKVKLSPLKECDRSPVKKKVKLSPLKECGRSPLKKKVKLSPLHTKNVHRHVDFNKSAAKSNKKDPHSNSKPIIKLQSHGVKSPKSTVKFNGIFLNTPARRAFLSKNIKTPAVKLSPLTPRTISRLSKMSSKKSPEHSSAGKKILSPSKGLRTPSGSKTPTSVKSSSPVLNRRTSLRHSGRKVKKIGNLMQ